MYPLSYWGILLIIVAAITCLFTGFSEHFNAGAQWADQLIFGWSICNMLAVGIVFILMGIKMNIKREESSYMFCFLNAYISFLIIGGYFAFAFFMVHPLQPDADEQAIITERFGGEYVGTFGTAEDPKWISLMHSVQYIPKSFQLTITEQLDRPVNVTVVLNYNDLGKVSKDFLILNRVLEVLPKSMSITLNGGNNVVPVSGSTATDALNRFNELISAEMIKASQAALYEAGFDHIEVEQVEVAI